LLLLLVDDLPGGEKDEVLSVAIMRAREQWYARV
jgi:hypothetical protein